MFRIEIIGENCLYIKTLGTFPKSVAKRFVKEFEEKTKNYENFCTIIDNLDAILLDVRSFNIILELLKKNNEKLGKAAYVISAHNLPLDKEIEILLEKADSPNRKIVHNLDEAKEWVGIKDIIIGKE
ncbi:MAG: hypothetical protein EU529_08845 [Promethearchaeota archaeon]|nr:MAG: hypothetical protein EU529_08845 [Candidatus Lokiarchaeota archaeon]